MSDLNITAILPIGVNAHNRYLISRCENLVRECLVSGMNVIVSSVGSLPVYAEELKSKLPEEVTLLVEPGKSFNLSRARNLAIKRVLTEWVLILDVDLSLPLLFSEKITTLLDQEFMSLESSFISFPVCYLKKGISPEGCKNVVGSSVSFEHLDYYVTASSVILVRCALLQNLGGYCEGYIGWGFEDHEMGARLIAESCLFDKPRAPTVFDPRPLQDQTWYRGWRAVYALHGKLAENYGLVFVHGWHPESASFKNDRQFLRNRQLFIRNTKKLNFSKTGAHGYFSLGSDIYSQFGRPDFDSLWTKIRYFWLEWKFTSNLYFNLRHWILSGLRRCI